MIEHRVGLCCDNLGELNYGMARGVIDHCIAAALADLDDRAERDGKPRKVTIELTLERMDNGQVASDVKARFTAPPYGTNKTVHDVRKVEGGQKLMFSVHSPERPEQLTIHDHTAAAAAEAPGDGGDDHHGRRADNRR